LCDKMWMELIGLRFVKVIFYGNSSLNFLIVNGMLMVNGTKWGFMSMDSADLLISLFF